MTRALAALCVAGAALACAPSRDRAKAPPAALVAAPSTSAWAPPPVERFPAPGARDVCPDPPFRLVFPVPVRLGTGGAARLVSVGRAEPLDRVDFAARVRTQTIEEREFRVERPVRLLDEHTVELRFRPGATGPGGEYAVVLDAGTVTSLEGLPVAAVGDDGAWRFSTRPALPAASAELTVAADGSGDFCTLQGALSSIPAGNEQPVTVRLRAGIYHELVLLSDRSGITLVGDGAGKSILQYPNNERLQEKRGSAFRAVMSAENVRDLTVQGLTIRNLTPQGGSQAEALRVEPGDRVILRDSELVSRQDTLKLTGRVYAERCRVEGNVDYVWGSGTAYFSDCDFHVVARAGWEVQARNPEGRYGYVFVGSRLTAEPGITGHLLARIDAERFPASHVAYVDCRMGPHIAPAGFEVTPPGAKASGVRFWELGSTDLAGRPLDLRDRHSASRRLTEAEARKLRDPAAVLAGWDPVSKRNSGTGGKPP